MFRVPAATLAAMVLVLPCSASRRAEDGAAVQVVFAALGADEIEADEVRARLRALGPDAIPALFVILADGAVRVASGETRLLTAKLDGAVVGALVAQPLGLLRDFLETVSAAQPPEAKRHAAMRLLAEVGTELDLLLLIHFASPPEGEAGVPRARRIAFEGALGRILERGPKGTWTLRSYFGDTESSLLAPIVRRIGALDTEEALRVLSTLLSRVEAADPIVLAEMTRLGDVVPHPVDEFVLATVRSHLGRDDSTAVRLAMQTLASLEDYNAIPMLLRCLENEDENLRNTAGDALRRITARGYRTDFRAWDRWYRDEMQWWTQESAASFHDLTALDSAEALRAILDVAPRRLFRHELATALADALGRQEVELLVLTCSTLEHLGSAAVVSDLVNLLDHDDARVSSAAWSALVNITGRDLPPDRELWRAVL